MRMAIAMREQKSFRSLLLYENHSCLTRERTACPFCTMTPSCINNKIATLRLQYEDDYKYQFSILSTCFRFGGQKFSKCACSELKTRTRSRPRITIRRSLIMLNILQSSILQKFEFSLE